MALRLHFWREREWTVAVVRWNGGVLRLRSGQRKIVLDCLFFLGLVLLLVDFGVRHERLWHLFALLIGLVGVVLLHGYFAVFFLLCL